MRPALNPSLGDLTPVRPVRGRWPWVCMHCGGGGYTLNLSEAIVEALAHVKCGPECSGYARTSNGGVDHSPGLVHTVAFTEGPQTVRALSAFLLVPKRDWPPES